MGLLDDLYNTGRAIIGGAANGVNILFNWAASGLYNTFNSITNFVRNGLNWAWQGFETVYRAIQNAITGLGAIFQNIFNWVMSQFRSLYTALMGLMDDLFRLTQDKIMEYGEWQASMQLGLESGLLDRCQSP